MIMKMTIRVCLSGVAFQALMLATPVYAQIAQPAGPGGAREGAASSAGGEPEILVTAQKRSESINKVGAPIVALGTVALKEQGVKSLADLAAAVPGLSYSPSGRNDSPVYTLRGVGFTDGSLASYPDVTVYLDQAPLPFPALTGLSNFDLARVEVLVGPQGTLFGSNATGGAINYVAERPTSTLKGGATLDFGRFNNLLADAYISGPLSDHLRFRVATRVNHADDWQYSYTRKDSTGKASTWAVRGLLDWDATDRLSFNLNINGWHDGTDPQQPQFYALSIQNPGVAPAYELNYPKAPHTPRATDFDPNLPLYNDSWLFQSSLHSAYQLTDNVTITSLTSYIVSKRNSFQQDGGANFAQSDYGQSGWFHDFFQELRLDNGSHQRARWTVGANYARDDVTENSIADYSENTTFFADGITGDRFQLIENTRSYAGFGALEYDIIPTVTLKGGLRYTQTNRTSSACVRDNGDGTLDTLFSFLQNLASGKTNPPLTLNDCVSLNPATGLAGIYRNKLDQHNLSYRAGIDWKPTGDLLFYANVSRGYKAGGVPSVDGSDWTQFFPVKQESVTDYEGGFKAHLFDRRLLITGDGFYYNYKDKQLHAKVVDPVFGSLDGTVNIPKSSVRGGELAVSLAPVSGFTPSVSATYLIGTIDKYFGVNAGGGVGDFSHTRMPFVPKWSINADLGYKWSISRNVNGFAGANMVYRSSTNSLVGEPANYTIPGYTLLNLRAGFEAKDNLWKVFVYGKNVTNKYYITTVSEQYDYIVRFTGRPATYGISITRNF